MSHFITIDQQEKDAIVSAPVDNPANIFFRLETMRPEYVALRSFLDARRAARIVGSRSGAAKDALIDYMMLLKDELSRFSFKEEEARIIVNALQEPLDRTTYHLVWAVVLAYMDLEKLANHNVFTDINLKKLTFAQANALVDAARQFWADGDIDTDRVTPEVRARLVKVGLLRRPEA